MGRIHVGDDFPFDITVPRLTLGACFSLFKDKQATVYLKFDRVTGMNMRWQTWVRALNIWSLIFFSDILTRLEPLDYISSEETQDERRHNQPNACVR